MKIILLGDVHGSLTTLEAGLHLAQLAMTIAQTTEAAREGPRAFVEKREARFAGR